MPDETNWPFWAQQTCITVPVPLILDNIFPPPVGAHWVHSYAPKWRVYSTTGYAFQHSPAMPRTYKFYGSIRRLDEW